MSTWASLPNNFRHETHSLLERILWMTGSQQQFKVFYLSLNRRLPFVGFFSHSQTQTKKIWKSRINSSKDQRKGQNYYLNFLVSVLYEFQVSWLKKCQVLLLHILITLLFNSSSVCSRILSTKSMLINPVAFHHSSLSGFCKFNQSIHK